jgi:transposase
MEACCGSHFVVAALTARGHDVKLMPVQFVKPFLNGLPGEICTIENEELV